MSRNRFYHATGKRILGKLEQHFTDAERTTKKIRREVKKRFNASGFLTSDMYPSEVSGIIADKCPEEFYRIKEKGAESNWWQPRRGKKYKEVQELLKSWEVPSVQHIMKIVGVPFGFLNSIGYQWHRGLELFIFQVPTRTFFGPVEYDPPRGVKRITDIEWEALAAVADETQTGEVAP